MASVKSQSTAISISATGEIIPAVTGKRIVVFSYVVTNTVATAQSVQFTSGGTAISGVTGLPSSIGGGLAISSGSAELGLLIGAAHGNLAITLGASTAVGGHIAFQYVPC